MKRLLEEHEEIYEFLGQEHIERMSELVEYYNNVYNPEEHIEHVPQITALMLVINILDKENKVAKLPFFAKVIRDIKVYIKDIHHFEMQYVNVCFVFCREVMLYTDQEIMHSLFLRILTNFPRLTSSQVANACLNSFLLLDRDSRGIKEEFFKRLEVYLVSQEQQLRVTMKRKEAQRVIIGLSATKMGSPEAWRIAEGILLVALDRESKDVSSV